MVWGMQVFFRVHIKNYTNVKYNYFYDGLNFFLRGVLLVICIKRDASRNSISPSRVSILIDDIWREENFRSRSLVSRASLSVSSVWGHTLFQRTVHKHRKGAGALDPLMGLLFTSRRRVSADALGIASPFENQSLYRISARIFAIRPQNRFDRLPWIRRRRVWRLWESSMIFEDSRILCVRWIEDICLIPNSGCKEN